MPERQGQGQRGVKYGWRGLEPGATGAQMWSGFWIVLRVIRRHHWDFSKGLGGSREGSGWVTWPWAA